MSEKVPYKKALEMLYEKNAENADLRTQLEQAKRERDKWKQKFKAGCQDDAEQCPVIDENADLKKLLREIYNSIPATYDKNDSMVKRHARALNEIKKILDREGR